MRFLAIWLSVIFAAGELPPDIPDVPPEVPGHTWRVRHDDPDRVYLYHGTEQVGGWCYSRAHYRPLGPQGWGEPQAQAPVPPPVRPAAKGVSQSAIPFTPAIGATGAGHLSTGSPISTATGRTFIGATFAGPPGGINCARG